MNYISRHIKIFISSTFQDMQEERKVLLKEVFLELKKIARQRDVEITEIDLRWGITEEAAGSGKTVKICLDEIERCKDSPIFFLGMIGNRYGWNEWYDDIDKNLLNDERYAWIEEYKDKSITELEIRSVLRKDSNNKVFLYLKVNNSKDDMSVKKFKKELIDISSKKENIDIDTYSSIDMFRQKVKEDLRRILDELYPENEKLTEKEKIYLPHMSFSRERQKLYYVDKDAYSSLTELIHSNNNILSVYGQEGIGKSSLIANYFNRDFSIQVVRYYIGCISDKNLETIISEIEILSNLESNIDIKSKTIDNFISRFLKKIVNSNKPLFIIIDGIDLLNINDKNIFLYHLVEEFEGKDTDSKIILTGREKESQFKAYQKLVPLFKEEKQELIEQYMLKYGKKLPREAVDDIAIHDNSSNLYFLTILLNEIRLLGDFNTLGSNLQYYLESENTIELFEKILLRFEQDYGQILTQNSLSLLYIVRDGLSEDELFELLNYIQEDGILTRLDFSPLFLAIEIYLENTNGSYKLKNKYLKEVVEYRYLFTQEVENEIRNYIAHFFWDQTGSFDQDKRAVRETIYQVYETGDIAQIGEFILIPTTFSNLILFDRDMLLKYVIKFDELNAESNFLDDLHKNIINEEFNFQMKIHIAQFISFDLSAKDAALKLLHTVEKFLVENTETDNANLAECYEMMAGDYQYNARKWGDKEAKVLSVKYAKKASEYVGNFPLVLAKQYYIEAKDFQYSNQFRDKGLEKYIQSLKLKEEVLGELDDEVIFSYRDLGNICESQGLYAEADQFFTLAWRRSKVYYGELSKETYHAGRNITGLYIEHSTPMVSLEDYIKSIEEECGKQSEESLKIHKEYYDQKPGWEEEDFEKLLEVSLLTLESNNIYSKSDVHEVILNFSVAKAYYHTGDIKNYQKYIKLTDKNISINHNSIEGGK